MLRLAGIRRKLQPKAVTPNLAAFSIGGRYCKSSFMLEKNIATPPLPDPQLHNAFKINSSVPPIVYATEETRVRQNAHVGWLGFMVALSD